MTGTNDLANDQLTISPSCTAAHVSH